MYHRYSQEFMAIFEWLLVQLQNLPAGAVDRILYITTLYFVSRTLLLSLYFCQLYFQFLFFYLFFFSIRFVFRIGKAFHLKYFGHLYILYHKLLTFMVNLVVDLCCNLCLILFIYVQMFMYKRDILQVLFGLRLESLSGEASLLELTLEGGREIPNKVSKYKAVYMPTVLYLVEIC